MSAHLRRTILGTTRRDEWQRRRSPCPCGAEPKQPHQVLGPNCWKSMPRELKERFAGSNDDGRRAAIREMMEIARNRNPQQTSTL